MRKKGNNMANFEQRLQPSQLSIDWLKGAYVSTDVNYEDTTIDNPNEPLLFAWFHLTPNLQDHPLEEKERIQAIRYQIDNHIIDKYGYPVGMPKPKEVKEQIKKLEEQEKKKQSQQKKRQKVINKYIEKDIAKQNKPMVANMFSFDKMGLESKPKSLLDQILEEGMRNRK
jgi:hypothetical protein